MDSLARCNVAGPRLLNDHDHQQLFSDFRDYATRLTPRRRCGSMTCKVSPYGTFARELPFGAAFDPQRGTTFRLWAPSQPSVLVEIDGGVIVPMSRQPDGVFEGRIECQADARYRFRLASGEAIPDPASRAQIDDVHGFSVVVDPRAYRWKHPERR